MTKKHFSINSIILAVLLGVSFLFLPCLTPISFSGQAATPVAWASSTSAIDVTTSAGLSDPNFTNGSGTSNSPQTPSKWSVSDSSGVTPEYTGIVNLSGSSISNSNTRKNYGFTKYNDEYLNTSFFLDPDGDDTKVLLINSPTDPTSYGYSSSSFNLEANSYYEIKMYVYTYQNASASVYLIGNDFDESAKIINIKSTKNWQIVSFFIKTSNDSNPSAKLELFMGEKNKPGCTGFVCFDNISIMQLSKSAYTETKQASTNYLEVDLTSSLTPITEGNGYVKNGDFATDLTDWESSGVRFANFNESVLINGENVFIGTNQYGDNTGALLIANNSFASLKSSEFDVARMKTYRINFWAKHSITSGDAKFEIVGNQSEEAYLVPEEQSASITNLETGTAINNEWTNYDLYITGDSRFDTTAYIRFSLGSEEETATGYVAIAGIRSYEVTNSEKTKATSANSNNASLSMENSTSLTFANSTFNSVTIEDDQLPTPNDWTQLNSNNFESGVVNVKTEYWENTSTTCPSKANNYSDNVLQIHNSNDNSYQAYKSDSATVSADSCAKLTFDVRTQDVNGAVWATLTDGNNNLIYKLDIDSSYRWTTYTVAIKNYNQDLELQLTLYLGNSSSPATGYAFFDNCTLNTSLTEDEFNGLTISENTKKIDLSTETITANDNGQPRYLTQTTDSGSPNVGIVKAKDFNLGVSKNTLDGPNDGNDEVLYIYSSTPTNTKLTTNFSYTFDTDNYYKVSVKVKTIGVQKSDEYRFGKNGEKVLYGATFRVEGIDKYFTGINTRTSTNDLSISQQFAETSNEWVEYSIYINVEESKTGHIIFGLGNDEIKASGYVFFTDLNVKTLTEDEYKSQTSTYETEVPFNVLLATSTEDDEDEDNTQTSFDSAAWFAIPTAIIAVAVIVAIVGYFIRRAKREKPVKEKIGEADYNRLSTLLKDVDKKERKTEIKHKITLLREELKQSEKYLAEETEELRKVRAGEVDTTDGKPINPKQLEKSIETQKAKISEIELDIKVLEAEYQKILDKQK